MNIILLIGGLLLILLGANGLTDGAASVAKRFGIPDIVIGLTIVAFGTSAPELTVSVASALQGSADIAVGNVVGSNIFNILVIVGVTSLVAPIVVTRNTLVKEIPLCILASLVMAVCAGDVWLDGGFENVISQTEGLLLLGFFAIFLSYTFAIAHKSKSDEGVTTAGADASSAAGADAPSPVQADVTAEPDSPAPQLENEEEIKELPLWRSVIYILAGLAGLVIGGNLFVEGASGIARGLGVSEAVIGLTLVAGGTSLPELATSVVAALKKNPEIAIGNVIGSNLFNIFFVLGSAATITPLHVQGIGPIDFIALIGSAMLMWFFGVFFGKRTITRIEGSVLVLCYIAYTAILIYNL